MPHFDVTGIGTAACDYRVQLERFPSADEKVRAPGMVMVGGGTVGTALVTVARLGYGTAWAGVLGDDAFGEFILDDLEHEGVDTRAVTVVPGVRSPFAFCAASGTERRVISVQPTTPPLVLTPDLVDHLLDTWFIHLDGKEPELALSVAKAARSREVGVSLDLQRLESHSHDLLALADLAVVSESFAQQHSPGLPHEEFVQALFRPGMRLTAVTLGSRGSIGFDGKECIRVPARALDSIESAAGTRSIDTTGAGDAYHGALLAGLLHGHTIPRAMAFAAHVAALSCLTSNRESLPRRDEVPEWW